MRHLIILFVFLLPVSAWATARTATVSCNINDAATCGWTWADGDTLTINNGVTVTVPTGYTMIPGTSPADDVSTPAIQPASTTGTGVLVINGTLKFRGTVKQANATWTANAGAIIEHDSSQAATPATTYYSWQIGMAASQTNAKLVLQGTGAGVNRVLFRNSAGSGRFGGFSQGSTIAARNNNIYPAGGLLGAGRLEAYWTTFTSLGVPVHDFVTADIRSGQSIIFEHCLITDCTMVNIISFSTSSNFRFKYSTISSPTDTVSMLLNTTSAVPISGDRVIDHAVFEGQFQHEYVPGLTITKSLFAGKNAANGSAVYSAEGAASYGVVGSDIMVWNRNTGANASYLPYGTYNRVVSIRSTPGSTAHSHLRFSTPTLAANLTINGLVSERVLGAKEGGIVIIEGTSVYANNLTISNVLDVPSYLDGLKSTDSIVVSQTSAANFHLSIKNCTVPVSAANTGIYDVETNGGAAGYVLAIQNNLIWRSTTGIGYIVWRNNLDATANSIVSADYNAAYNITTSPYYYNFASGAYQSAPGTHDVSANPQFVNATRNIVTWGTSLSASTNTPDLILAQMLKMNDDSGYDSRYDWTAYYTWVTAGFAPKNQLLKTAGYSGTYIGAVQPVAATKKSTTSGFQFPFGWGF